MLWKDPLHPVLVFNTKIMIDVIVVFFFCQLNTRHILSIMIQTIRVIQHQIKLPKSQPTYHVGVGPSSDHGSAADEKTGFVNVGNGSSSVESPVR